MPFIVHSDRGSQLVAAKKELCDDPIHYDWDAIRHAYSQQGTPHQVRNGVTVLPRYLSRSSNHPFTISYKETKLNYAQLLSAVKRLVTIF